MKNVHKHSRMRRQSSGLVTAADKNSDIGVLFDVDFDLIVSKGCFQQGGTLNFLKKLQNFFCFNFRATPWRATSSTNKKMLVERAGDLFYFVCLLLLAWPLFLYVLKACVPKILLLFTCRLRNRRVVERRPSKHMLPPPPAAHACPNARLQNITKPNDCSVWGWRRG